MHPFLQFLLLTTGWLLCGHLGWRLLRHDWYETLNRTSDPAFHALCLFAGVPMLIAALLNRFLPH